MSGVEASVWIRMKRAWDRKPAVKERVDTLPTGMRTITAMPESAPPHLTYPMPEHGESASVTRYGVVLIETQTHTSQPCSDLCEWLVHPKAQRLLKLLQLCSHPRISRFSPDYEQATWGLPTHMGKSQKRERLGFSLSSRAPVLGGQPPELQQRAFSPDGVPARILPSAPETASGSARRPRGAEDQSPDHQRNGPLPPARGRSSAAKPLSKDRKRNAGTRWRAMVKPRPPAASRLLSPPVCRLPSPRPSTISGSGAGCGCRPRGAEGIASSIRGSFDQRSSECRHPAPSSLCCAPVPHTRRQAPDAGYGRAGTHTKSP